MKKLTLITIAALFLTLFGCQKETVKDCNCGIVANDGIDGSCYWLELRNNCTGNKKKFCVDQDKWFQAYAGTEFCITNSGQW
jgi:hypothetical protein